jgi:AcrR family transcriptional regulator
MGGDEQSRVKSAEATRSRIFEAAKIRFSRSSYEAASVREIAGDAEVDPALLIRYFGSKEGLFRAVAADAFQPTDMFAGDPNLLGERILDLLFAPADKHEWRSGYDPFRLLLSSISSDTAGPIISEAFHRAFVDRLAKSLSGRSKGARAALVSSYILGVALLRITEPEETFQGTAGLLIRRRLSDALAVCLSQ